MANRIFFHIGHPKTGSSYLQSLLSANVHQLADQWIHYPQSKWTEKAREGGVTPGNCKLEQLLDHRYRDSFRDLDSDLLFSSEKLFVPLSEGTDFIEPFRDQFEEVHLLLFTRNPFDFLRSHYVQRVKTCDFNGSLDDYVLANEYGMKLLEQVEAVVRLCRQQGYRLTLKNYSTLRTPIDTVLANFLGIQKGWRVPAAHPLINRGFTASELYLQRRMSHHLPGKAAYHMISYPLCTALPHIPSDPPRASDEVYGMVESKLNQRMEELNKLLPEGEYYERLASPQPGHVADGDVLAFSKEQIDVIAAGIAERFQRLEPRKQRLEPRKRRRGPLRRISKKIRQGLHRVLRRLCGRPSAP